MNFANVVKPFECKDIKTALTELMEAQRMINDLKNKLKVAMDQLEENNGACFLWSFCLNQTQIGGFGTAMFIFGCIVSILTMTCCCQKLCFSPCNQQPCCVTRNFHTYSLTEQNLRP